MNFQPIEIYFGGVYTSFICVSTADFFGTYVVRVNTDNKKFRGGYLSYIYTTGVMYVKDKIYKMK